jgi:hypothetical protein
VRSSDAAQNQFVPVGAVRPLEGNPLVPRVVFSETEFSCIASNGVPFSQCLCASSSIQPYQSKLDFYGYVISKNGIVISKFGPLFSMYFEVYSTKTHRPSVDLN